MFNLDEILNSEIHVEIKIVLWIWDFFFFFKEIILYTYFTSLQEYKNT